MEQANEKEISAVVDKEKHRDERNRLLHRAEFRVLLRNQCSSRQGETEIKGADCYTGQNLGFC
jgi:hypothetical protein